MRARAQVEKNERLFREVNERIREIAERLALAGGPAEEVSFMCECASTDCTDRIELSLDDYGRVRADPAWFVVATGHELPEFERVIERAGAFTIVEKELLGEPGTGAS